MKRRALFLDRDGTINIDYGYVYQRKNFQFIDGIFELVATAKKLDYLVVVVTNQSGIGRGYYTESEFEELMLWMKGQFACRGGHIDAIYFCPDHPEFGQGKYKRDTLMRKPGPGMILEAAQSMNIDLSHSLLVGDSPTDLIAGNAAGVGCLCYFSESLDDSFERVNQVTCLTQVIPFLRTV